MGVPGLTRFVDARCSLTRVELGADGPTLVLDGHGLAHAWHAATGLDSARGGELVTFRAIVRQRAQELAQLPCVAFFDADHAVDAAKRAATIARRRASRAHMPLLAVRVTREEIARAGIPVHVAGAAQAEADPDIARFARAHPGCVVVSNDSDMLIFEAVDRVARFDAVAASDAVAQTLDRDKVLLALGLRDAEELAAMAALAGFDLSDADDLSRAEGLLSAAPPPGRRGRAPGSQRVVACAAYAVSSARARPEATLAGRIASHLGCPSSFRDGLASMIAAARTYYAAADVKVDQAEASDAAVAEWWWPRVTLGTPLEGPLGTASACQTLLPLLHSLRPGVQLVGPDASGVFVPLAPPAAEDTDLCGRALAARELTCDTLLDLLEACATSLVGAGLAPWERQALLRGMQGGAELDTAVELPRAAEGRLLTLINVLQGAVLMLDDLAAGDGPAAHLASLDLFEGQRLFAAYHHHRREQQQQQQLEQQRHTQHDKRRGDRRRRRRR